MSNASGGISSADACSNGHSFIFAGTTPMPDGWPCQCGKTRWSKPSDYSCEETAKEVRDHYEGLIDKGELITKEEHLRLVREAEDRASFRWTEA